MGGKSNEIDLVSTTIEPRGTKEELSKIKDVLGTFSTDFSTSKQDGQRMLKMHAAL